MKAQNGGQQELLPAGERIDEAPQWFAMHWPTSRKTKPLPMKKRKFIIANGPALTPMRRIWFWCMAAAPMRVGMISSHRF